MSLKSFVKTLTCCVVLMAANNAAAENNEIKEHKTQFKAFYEKEWGQTQPCKETSLNRYSVCSNVLRNEGNATFYTH